MQLDFFSDKNPAIPVAMQTKRKAFVKSANDLVISLGKGFPSKFRIDEARLVTSGKKRNMYFNLHMR